MKAPDFVLSDAEGQQHALSDFKGKKVVLYFYPRDDTPGCTTEACNFRDAYDQITEAGAVVIGVSADSVESHEKFAKKYSLPFVLLSDPEKKAIQDYKVWVEKSMYGKKYMGIERSTFVIDEEGNIAHEFRKVSPSKHVDEILKVL